MKRRIVDAWAVVDCDGFIWEIQTFGRNQGQTSREARQRCKEYLLSSGSNVKIVRAKIETK